MQSSFFLCYFQATSETLAFFSLVTLPESLPAPLFLLSKSFSSNFFSLCSLDSSKPSSLQESVLGIMPSHPDTNARGDRISPCATIPSSLGSRFLDFSKNLKMLLEPMGKYVIGALFTYCHTSCRSPRSP